MSISIFHRGGSGGGRSWWERGVVKIVSGSCCSCRRTFSRFPRLKRPGKHFSDTTTLLYRTGSSRLKPGYSLLDSYIYTRYYTSSTYNFKYFLIYTAYDTARRHALAPVILFSIFMLANGDGSSVLASLWRRILITKYIRFDVFANVCHGNLFYSCTASAVQAAVVCFSFPGSLALCCDRCCRRDVAAIIPGTKGN